MAETGWQIVRATYRPEWSTEKTLARLEEDGVDLDALVAAYADGAETAYDIVSRFLVEFDAEPVFG